ncbi:menaquinone-dependent protoporphyrinogen IX dehydrogenase [Ferrimonas lipolytica]|uniref:Protoporphyrinogen IX dehydrogenase [quinone] n=1 Tax=Ferrimonas lipolytica TaxID=2724191 RepID=A0A6H1UK71_9GAMM|nr:menaquinone-dependent protoporphyrinogen IX dehydrogenase [Ferrimonas lipolytica]QIZ78202.1 menaquinone-dependent protoporphyrinogen IX dehydrogenase [Ferrimonas lipolytica]
MQRTLLLYSTVDGHTKKIIERIKDRLEALDHWVQLAELERCQLDLTQFDSVVVGASIRYGKYRPALFEFIEENQVTLQERPCAFFSVNLVARKPNKNTPETNSYVGKFLQQSSWRPALVGVFAGKLNYSIYGWRDRWVIRFIMWLTKGPTNPDTNKEFTDWGKVELFADQLASLGSAQKS